MDGLSDVKSLQYDFHTIEVATDKFAANNKLGEGGFGILYKGILPDGHTVAVKRFQKSGKGETEFKNEVLFLAKLQHQNLVRLLGFCLEGEEKIFIYEFTANGSLDQFMFDKTSGADLDWAKRHKIIGQIAHGLLYLHDNSGIRIIHRDLKASNILLDEGMNAKIITGYGTAVSFTQDESEIGAEKIAGSYGYMAPEAFQGRISPKTDVYSFGVLVLEIVSGKKVSQMFGDEENAESLLTYAWKMWREGTISNLIDKNLLQSSPTQEIMRCIHIGLFCVQENTSDRPTMSSVVDMLNSTSITLAVPSINAFCQPTN